MDIRLDAFSADLFEDPFFVVSTNVNLPIVPGALALFFRQVCPSLILFLSSVKPPRRDLFVVLTVTKRILDLTGC